MKIVLNPEFNLYQKENRIFCDSLQVAETFNKQHKSILQTIEGENRKGVHIEGLIDGISQSAGNPADYFEKSSYKDSRNRKYSKYLLTKDGFTLLAMGFTGAKALKFKLEYIARFNQMEKFITSLLTAKAEFPMLTDAIKHMYDEPKHYHYTNEINMLYRIVVGKDAKGIREENGLQKGESIRGYLSKDQLEAVEKLQRVDIGLLEAGLTYEERKDKLTSVYRRSVLSLAV